MPSFNNAAYTNHPIQIPPEFPKILKQYTKAAIRTQPTDLLLWSVSYFRCLAKGEIPPVKERLEYPVPPTRNGLTPGLLRVLNKQLGHDKVLQIQELREKWRGICLALEHLDEILFKGKLGQDNLLWKSFIIQAALSIQSRPTVLNCMEIICETLSDHPEGNSSSLPQSEFMEYFRDIAKKLNVSNTNLEDAIEYLEDVSMRQEGVLMAQNIRMDAL